MKQFTYQIQDPNGLHARPAGALAKVAKGFSSHIKVKNGKKEADGKRLLSLMSLGAIHGATLCFSIEGEDEDTAAAELEVFCRTNLGGEIPHGE
jgi:phosphocarrier protein